MRISFLTTFVLSAVALLLTACEDPIPQDYTPDVVVEALLIVGQPIDNILIYNSQPLRDTFQLRRAVIRDADVSISGPNGELRLVFQDDSLGGHYRAEQRDIVVEPRVTYTLLLNTQGRRVTATTTTPPQIAFTSTIRDTIQYVGYRNETGAIPDSLRVGWTSAGPGAEYFIAMQNLDTLNYGSYLAPATTDSNERVRPNENEFDRTTPFNTETTRFAFVQGSDVFSWGAFKWYGKHVFNIYAGDRNFINFVKQVTFGGRQINENLQSFPNAIGYFGSASVISAPTFLKKESRN